MPSHPKTQLLQGVLYIFGAIFLFAGSDALSKYLAGFYAVVMVIWIRYVVHSGLMLTVMLPRSGFAVFKTRQPGLQLLRGLCMVGTNMLFISALRYIPLAEGTAIVYLGTSIESFPRDEQMFSLLQRCGYHGMAQHRLCLGIASIYTAIKA